MSTVTAFGTRRPAADDRGGKSAKIALPPSRGMVGAVLFVLVAFFLLAAGAVTGAPQGSGAPVEAGAFILDPSIGSARG
ncbi:MAG TPA: hypothetical protein VF574_04635 [Allosphingosinicella sp.]|jgi:hypothetical protein